MIEKRKVISASRPNSNLIEKSTTKQINDLERIPSIPVLTDVVPSAEKKQAAMQIKSGKQLPLLPDNQLWDEFEERLNKRIHKQVTERLNFVLDENLEQHISTILQQVLTLLVNEIKHDMQKTLEVMITHAVSTELERMKIELLTKDNKF